MPQRHDPHSGQFTGSSSSRGGTKQAHPSTGTKGGQSSGGLKGHAKAPKKINMKTAHPEHVARYKKQMAAHGKAKNAEFRAKLGRSSY